MFDFLNPKLLPKTSSNVGCMEGYEVENLISNNFLIKSRGFIAYTSIKPPVDVNFQLICPVNIRYISILSVNGTQRSNGIEILAKNHKCQLVSLAKAIFDQQGVVFCNSRIYSRNNPPPNSENFHIAFFKSHTFRQFTNATTVTIRIFRTDRNTVPCLGKVEIWGNVSKICSEVTMKTIQKIMEGIRNVNEVKVERKLDLDDFVVPDDFKDALTYEIMAIPMTLPSGHSVDQSTLEKCVQHDHSNGRQASDPFTGLMFTDSRKPALNVALKTRIDMFLLQHSNEKEVAMVPRTVGTLNNKKCNQVSTKRSYSAINDENLYHTANKIMKMDYVPLNSNTDSSEDSLMETINKVMNSVNFVRFTEENQEEIDNTCCKSCESRDNLYELPCLHLYCRTCLLELCKSLVCKVCKLCFKRCDPKKFNSI